MLRWRTSPHCRARWRHGCRKQKTGLKDARDENHNQQAELLTLTRRFIRVFAGSGKGPGCGQGNAGFSGATDDGDVKSLFRGSVEYVHAGMMKALNTNMTGLNISYALTFVEKYLMPGSAGHEAS
ncbi:hypothetical protein KC222_21185 [Cedecea davisae]|uniref:Uncharacterized protein n=1 Tax=Cedecea davisae TaxID=158484 RepID=A0ABS6DN20_9ENTR|nr:hypothetical protein [Cedecea davisae]MBU4684513.1 hypothetical protein [Cedecea davisae]MBU4688641.1 hypothetical protein [Cedecea davisae]